MDDSGLNYYHIAQSWAFISYHPIALGMALVSGPQELVQPVYFRLTFICQRPLCELGARARVQAELLYMH